VYARNYGASCSTCLYEGGSNLKACRRCLNANYLPGWEPKPGVKVRVSQAYYSHARNKGPFLVRTVVSE